MFSLNMTGPEAVMPTWRVEIEFLTGVMKDTQPRFVAERQLETEELRLVIGRSSDVDITIGDNTVSRRHCAVQLTPDGAMLVDLGSSGGTFAQGERVKQRLLSAGDKFIVGANSMLRLVSSDVF